MNDLITSYTDVFKTNKSYYNETVDAHLKRLAEIDELLPPSSTFIIVTNTTTYGYEFVSKNVTYATGLDRGELYAGGIRYLLERIHRDDVQVWLGALHDLMHFCMTEVEESRRIKINFQYNYRVNVRPGKTINLIENQIPLVLDEFGKPVIGLGHFTVYDDGFAYPIQAFAKVLNAKDEYETLFSKNYGIQYLLGGLTHREQDILRLMALGKTSKEIGSKLFISNHTVDTHRRNILQKLGISTTSEIISYCKNNKLF